MHSTERTPLARPLDSPNYVEFANLLRTRRTRIRQFQCCVCAIFITIFTMALVVSFSISVKQETEEELERNDSNLQSGPLKLGLEPNARTYSDSVVPRTVYDEKSDLEGASTRRRPPEIVLGLSEEEIARSLVIGKRAMEDRLSADAAASLTPLTSPSPDSRQRYAVSTSVRVKNISLLAVAEMAVTKNLTSMRSIEGKPSPIGSFFDGDWTVKNACRRNHESLCELKKYRSYDGSCNRPERLGSAMRAFRRVLQADYGDGLDAPRRAKSGRELPSAREVSLRVHKPSASSNPSFTVMLAVFGQFLDHDITATALSQGLNGTAISCCPPAVGHPECFPVKVGPGDPVYDLAGKDCMEFVRSAPAPQCKLGPREQLNQVSAFIDGSAIYGPDEETARDLREFQGGLLKMQSTPDNRTLLPASTKQEDGCNRELERHRGRYCFAAGDARANENLHLTTMHLIWARQHNNLAKQLSRLNPWWKDERVYQESRRIVIGQLQHITYSEFLPIVLGEERVSSLRMTPLKNGYRPTNDSFDDTANDPTMANHFSAAAFRFAHTLIPGLMRMTDSLKGTSSYVELHRMLFNPYSLYSEGGVDSSVMSAASNLVQRTTTHVTSQLTRHLFEDPLANNTVPCGLDLVSLNIQRGRDHGLPGYTKWRQYCGLGASQSFQHLQGHLDPQALQEISMLYESVDDIDLYTGALAEIPIHDGLVGPTITCLIADQFDRLQKGDRFWYEYQQQPYPFTEEQLTELRKTSLAGIICDCSDNITHIQPRVMRSTDENNSMMTCEDIPRPSLQLWKDEPMEGNVTDKSSANEESRETNLTSVYPAFAMPSVNIV
ncbi:peroxidase-like [Prorops nasuta]|uniref:peroxidase-like n=1 Tax=Prorops nasuta TaxID=863751 RepID=UPI0034CDFC68